MPTDRYGTTQVREVQVPVEDVRKLVIENICTRMGHDYNFDYSNPIVLSDGKGGFLLRFVEREITQDREARSMNLKKLEVSK